MNKLETIKLENGLTIYFYQDNKKHSTVFQFITKFGGITKDFIIDGKEVHFQDGLAHILEHFLVECNKYGNFLHILGKKEMDSNAVTSKLYTRYFFNAVENIEYGIKTILRSVYNPVFTEENLEKLKNPIYQELRARKNNRFFYKSLTEKDNCFHNIKFRNVGGTIEEVKNTTIDDLIFCYNTFYNPTNQLIVVAGNFNKEEVLKTIKEETKNLTFQKHDIKPIDLKEPKEVVKKYGEVIYPTPTPYLSVTYKIPIDTLTNLEQLKLDFYIGPFLEMNIGATSKLYNDVTKKKIITTGISRSINKIDNYLLLTIGSYTTKENELQEAIINTFKNISFNKELFELNKKRTTLNIILREESLGAITIPLIVNIIEYNYPYLDTVEDVEEFNFEEFKQYITSLDFSNYTITTIHNPKE